MESGKGKRKGDEKQVKTFIQNRKNQKVAVVVEEVENSKGLAFVMHGLGGTKDQEHIRAFVETFITNNISVISFDTTNTFGESDGNYEDATVTNYYEDLEDVIEWVSNQAFYSEPFFLVGHSLGGISVALYSQKYPDKVKGVAPISTVVSGKLSLEKYPKEQLHEWTKSGWKIKESSTTPGRIKKLKWNNHIEDRLKYDLVKEAEKMKMPVLLIVGDKDETTPFEHQEILFEKLPREKELHIIKGAPHTFKESQHLEEIKKKIDDWIKKVNK